MSTTESDEHDRGHGHGVLRDAKEKQDRQGFVSCGLQCMALVPTKGLAIVLSGIPMVLTALCRWLHGDAESPAQMLEG